MKTYIALKSFTGKIELHQTQIIELDENSDAVKDLLKSGYIEEYTGSVCY